MLHQSQSNAGKHTSNSRTFHGPQFLDGKAPRLADVDLLRCDASNSRPAHRSSNPFGSGSAVQYSGTLTVPLVPKPSIRELDQILEHDGGKAFERERYRPSGQSKGQSSSDKPLASTSRKREQHLDPIGQFMKGSERDSSTYGSISPEQLSQYCRTDKATHSNATPRSLADLWNAEEGAECRRSRVRKCDGRQLEREGMGGPESGRPLDKFDMILDEIQSRRTWLQEMDALGQGQKFRGKIVNEIEQAPKTKEEEMRGRA
ncbi:hypothetical protein M427DRAFT_58919 [Gonapodya prolifera JEL478]|uniref:Uncharacterized protein n=1 Tax=Gonapodya prolifera (strain JEL478) TaxID=1344416 RepID=A0A139A9W3_GONPJ|nr:hypothetical protein M427DRAFT_58919 [Gonapodya prolifera JEL478]|eukprot:KXS13203.1 hypothetical protein M427DRAFT_58919 [Gonapodya prolifera JEL478]